MSSTSVVQFQKPKPGKETSVKSSVDLTAKRVSDLQPQSRRYQVSDARVPGLAVRVFPSGAKSYVVNGRVGKGRTARKIIVTLGDTGAMRLAEAREVAQRTLVRMREGIDPNKRKEASISLSDLLDKYDLRLEARGVIKRADNMSVIRRNLKAYLSSPAEDLTRKQIVTVMDRLEAAGKQGAALYLRKCVASFLNWAVNADYLKANAMAGYRRERQTRAEKLERPKVTFTSDEQIALFWQATASEKPVFRDFLRMLMLNGGRRTETSLMEWGQIGDDAWSCPAITTKLGRDHLVPIGPLGSELLAQQPRHNATNLVFPGRHLKPMSGWSQRLRPFKETLGEPAFAFHALRRTYRTGLSRLGVDYDVAEMMIAHKRDDLHGRYDQSDLWPERVKAQNRWEEYVRAVVQRNGQA